MLARARTGRLGVRWFTDVLLVAHGVYPLRGGLDRCHGEQRVGGGDSGICTRVVSISAKVRLTGFPVTAVQLLLHGPSGRCGLELAVWTLLGEVQHQDAPHHQGRWLSRAGGTQGAGAIGFAPSARVGLIQGVSEALHFKAWWNPNTVSPGRGVGVKAMESRVGFHHQPSGWSSSRGSRGSSLTSR